MFIVTDVTNHNDMQNVIDESKLRDMKEALGAVFDELIPAYIEQSDVMVGDMMSVLDQDDLKSLERYAHSMKSSSLNVGGTNLSQLSAELEEMCRNSDSKDDMAIKVKSVSDEYEKVKSALLEFQ